MSRVAVLALLAAFPAGLSIARLLNPQTIGEPPTTSWPTYNGDYSGRRFSTLRQINSSTIHSLALAWMYRITTAGPLRGVASVEIKSTPLMVNGILYFTIPDHVYAVDARTGREVWHYDGQHEGGCLVGNRGVGL